MRRSELARTDVHGYATAAGRLRLRRPGVCRGRTIVERVRMAVHDVVGLIVRGASVDNVLLRFPALTRAQAYECLAFHEDHRAEIDALVAEQMVD
ncbi:MAG: DUF433 domain-containing protein [Verrucomicrobiota bacterium]|nr:DUF433 domain-containing protein [Verrucomicrobiota bacterium]